MKKIGIMQPYFFPYIGYFQLINVVDIFVIYDDVQYIKGGWINRNRILINGEPSYINLNIKNDSTFKLINERVLVDNKDFFFNKLKKKLNNSYGRAPYYLDVMDLIQNCFTITENNLSKILSEIMVQCLEYLKIKTEILISSDLQKKNNLSGEERVIEINTILGADQYINAFGGKELYSKKYFRDCGIQLDFLKTNNIEYKQFENTFVPNLSIIDVMMFNSPEKINQMLNEYELI